MMSSISARSFPLGVGSPELLGEETSSLADGMSDTYPACLPAQRPSGRFARRCEKPLLFMKNQAVTEVKFAGTANQSRTNKVAIRQILAR
jgi:hypothetical protein